VSKSSLLEQRNRRAEIAPIIALRHNPLPIHRDHIRAGLCAQTPEVHLGRTLDADHVLLAALGGGARLVPVVEKGVEAGAVDEDGGGRENAEAPGFLARVGGAAAEGGVEEGGVGSEGSEGVGVGLHVAGGG
jgi:hypothetical protein